MFNIKRIHFYSNRIFSSQCTEPDIYLSILSNYFLILSEINCIFDSFIHHFRDTYFSCVFSCLFILRLNYAVKLFCRANYWYINIYNLWLNTVFNIVLPIASLVILNILILRYVLHNIKYCVQKILAKHYPVYD